MYKEYCRSVTLRDRFYRSAKNLNPYYLKKIVRTNIILYGNSKDIDITTTNLEYLAQIVKQTSRFVLLSTQVDVINETKEYKKEESETYRQGLVLIAESTHVAIDNLNRYIEANKDSLQTLL